MDTNLQNKPVQQKTNQNSQNQKQLSPKEASRQRPRLSASKTKKEKIFALSLKKE